MSRTACRNPACARAPRKTSLIRLISLAFSVRRSRRALKRLDDAALRDISLSRQEAETEARRPIWDVPRNWRE